MGFATANGSKPMVLASTIIQPKVLLFFISLIIYHTANGASAILTCVLQQPMEVLCILALGEGKYGRSRKVWQTPHYTISRIVIEVVTHNSTLTLIMARFSGCSDHEFPGRPAHTFKARFAAHTVAMYLSLPSTPALVTHVTLSRISH